MRLTNRFSAALQSVTKAILVHTYTRTSFERLLDIDDNPVTDDEGQPVYVDITPVTNAPCLFFWSETTITNEVGTSTETVPTLWVLRDDPLRVGDIVSNVKDLNDNVLLVSAKIQTINPVAEGGASTVKVVTLEGAVVG
jgi:hypothetical protein